MRCPTVSMDHDNSRIGLQRAATRIVHKMTALLEQSFYLLIPIRGNPADTFNVFTMVSLPYPVQILTPSLGTRPHRNT